MDAKPRGHSCLGSSVHVPLSSHTAARTRREALRSKANRQPPAAGTSRATPPGTSRRYEFTAAPERILKQALRGWVRFGPRRTLVGEPVAPELPEWDTSGDG